MKRVNKLMVITGGLLLSGGLIAGLASAAVHKHSDQHADGYMKGNGYGHHMSFKVKKLDTNDDGAVSQEEMLARHSKQFSKLDIDSDGMLSKEEFNARHLAMFATLDVDGDGLIAGDELPRRHKGGKNGGHHSKHHDHDQPATPGTAS